jgi:hypothetical protein
MMRDEKIEIAIKEAERFIKTAKTCLLARQAQYTVGDYVFNNNAPKESGATRRASMDLTRQLAEMRKP